MHVPVELLSFGGFGTLLACMAFGLSYLRPSGRNEIYFALFSAVVMAPIWILPQGMFPMLSAVPLGLVLGWSIFCSFEALPTVLGQYLGRNIAGFGIVFLWASVLAYTFSRGEKGNLSKSIVLSSSACFIASFSQTTASAMFQGYKLHLVDWAIGTLLGTWIFVLFLLLVMYPIAEVVRYKSLISLAAMVTTSVLALVGFWFSIGATGNAREVLTTFILPPAVIGVIVFWAVYDRQPKRASQWPIRR